MSDRKGKGGIIPFAKQNFSKWGSDDALLHVESSEARGLCGAERLKRWGMEKGGVTIKGMEGPHANKGGESEKRALNYQDGEMSYALPHRCYLRELTTGSKGQKVLIIYCVTPFSVCVSPTQCIVRSSRNDFE